MDTFLVVLKYLFSTTNIFVTMTTAALFLHCFYDTKFTFTKKKCIVFLITAIADSILFIIFYKVDLWSNTYYIFLTFVAIYDYDGNKVPAFFRYLLVIFLLILCSNAVSRCGFYLMFPEENASFMGQVPELPSAEEILKILTMDDMELLQYLQSADTSADIVVPPTMHIFNFVLNTVFFGSISYFLYHRLYKQGIVIKSGTRELIFAIAYPCFCLSLPLALTLLTVNSDVVLPILSAMGIAFALMAPVIMYSSRIGKYYEKRNIEQEQHMQAELSHFQQYKQTQEETSRFRHDIRNNLLCVNDMLNKGNTDAATEYLKDLLQIVEGLSKKYITGDALLDSIVGLKSQIMQKYSITFELDGVLAGGLPWKPMDICNVFANALDNAIEACQFVVPERRIISMKIRSTPQFWFVTIENPVVQAVDVSKLFQKKNGYTTKDNAARHGMGTYAIKHTVESYGAMLKAECAGQVFKLEIMIDKSSPV